MQNKAMTIMEEQAFQPDVNVTSYEGEIGVIEASQDVTADDMLALAEYSGVFDFLDSPEEDIYTQEDGSAV